MRRRRALLLLALGLAGCAASPTPDLYALAFVPGAVRHGVAGVIEVRRPGLAGYLDRSEIVRTVADYRLGLAANHRWGEPLAGMLARVLAEDLAQRLPEATVFAEGGAISAAPDRVVEIDVQRFDADADGSVVLLAEAAIGRGESEKGGARLVLRRVRPAGPGVAAQVAAMSAALGQLADAVAGMLGG